MKFLLLLLIPAMAWLDRQRGTSKDLISGLYPGLPGHRSQGELIPKWLALAGLGLCVAFLTGHYWDWQAIVIALAVAIGYSTGWGHPLGTVLGGLPNKRYEWWQRGILRDRPWLAIAVRGTFIGVLSLAAFDIIASIKIFFAFTVAFPLAPFLVTKAFKKSGDEAWAEQEYWRGGIAALILWALSWA